MEFDTIDTDIWDEIQDSPREIFDNEISDEDLDQSFESKLNSKNDF